MSRHRSLHYRIISVMFWAFPYLLWQAFGHWSGFLVGVIVAVVLTAMFNGLFRGGDWKTASTARRRSLPTAEPQPQRQEMEPYQRGYRAEEEPDCEAAHLNLAGELQSSYEEMQVPCCRFPDRPGPRAASLRILPAHRAPAPWRGDAGGTAGLPGVLRQPFPGQSRLANCPRVGSSP